MEAGILQVAKIALHRNGERYVLDVRVRCSSEEEAQELMRQSGQGGRVVVNRWKDVVSYWAHWRGRAAARLLHVHYGLLTGNQQRRAGYGISYTSLIVKQRKGHYVGQEISEEQAAERRALVEKFNAIKDDERDVGPA